MTILLGTQLAEYIGRVPARLPAFARVSLKRLTYLSHLLNTKNKLRRKVVDIMIMIIPTDVERYDKPISIVLIQVMKLITSLPRNLSPSCALQTKLTMFYQKQANNIQRKDYFFILCGFIQRHIST